MKNHMLPVFAFLLLSIFTIDSTKSQIINPMPLDSSSTWRYNSFSVGGAEIWYNFSKLYCEGDTMIANKLYNKVYDFVYSYSYNYSTFIYGNYNYIDHRYRGGLRSSDSQCYYIHADETYEQLLYDFSLEVGDTLPNNFLIEPYYCIVTSIENISIGDHILRQFNLYSSADPNNFFGPYYVIEGIGNSSGPLSKLIQYAEHSTKLVCYAEQGIPLAYFNYYYPEECNITLSDNLLDETSSNSGVIPNPLTLASTITIPAINGIPVSLKIYTCEGRLIKEEVLRNTLPYKLERSCFKSGIYLFIMTDNRGRLIGRGKFVVL